MTLDLRADNPNLPELVKVPLRTFLPGVGVGCCPTRGCCWASRAGTRPMALLWESGSLKTLSITVSSTLNRRVPSP